jgi:predicted DNA-binding transcriptional regulator YafY
MKASRLLSILMLVQARGRVTAPELAATLQVSQRTVLRDIDELAAAGVPIWSDRGRNGGFQLTAGWSTQLTGLTEQEANALSLAGLPAAATELGLGAAAASARLKLIAGLPPEWRAQADQVAMRLHVDSVDWYRTKESPAYLQSLANSVWNGLRIIVKYESWSGVVKRELEPLGLILKAGEWYVAARDARDQKIKTYRASNVIELQQTRQKFKWPKQFDLAQSSARFELEIFRLQAKLRVSPRAIKWLKNARTPFVASPSVDSGNAKRNRARNSWQEISIPIESIEQGARQCLAWGAEVEILEPSELRNKVIADARAIASMYGRA